MTQEERIEEEEKNEIEDTPEISRNRKIAAGALAFFGVVIIFVWIANLKNSIVSPLAYKPGAGNDYESASCSGPDCPAYIELLKNQDTDSDGLSDYEEIYIYKTSPYLEDTDSDGYTDKEEIDGGNDPKCPKGKDCSSSDLLNANASVSENAGGAIDLFPNSGAFSGSGMSESEAEKMLSGQMTAAELRRLLIQSGMDQSILNQISDEQLMQSFQETMSGSTE